MRARAFLSLALVAALAGCGQVGRTAEPLPTVVLQGGGNATPGPAGGGQGGVSASGVVVPAQEAHLAFTLGGTVRSIEVKVGDQVDAGQLLVELDNTALKAQLEIARRAVRELTSPSAVAMAEQALAAAQKAADEAQKKVYALDYPRASEALIKNIQGEIELAREQVATTSNDFRSVESLEKDDPRRATALVAMTNAQMRLNQLIANYNWYTGNPSDLDIAVANSNLAVAKATLQEAEWYLSAVKGVPVPADASGSGLTLLQNARDGQAAAEAAYEGSRLVAPFAGTVASLDATVGDYVPPGLTAAIVADLSALRVETTDLSELDVSKVVSGQACDIFIKALNEEVTGHVVAVALLPTTLGGDVVYKVTIDLGSIPEGLRPGMTAEVTFGAGP